MIKLPYKLGDKLKANIATIKFKEDEEKARKEQAARARLQEERGKINRLFQYIDDQLILDINDGKIPRIKISKYEEQDWLKKAVGGDYIHDIDLWLAFELKWRAEGIKLKLEYCHDGMGMESWVEIVAEPI